MKHIQLFEEFINEAYKNIPYDMKIAGNYEVIIGKNPSIKANVRVAGFEREDNDSDSLYLMDGDKFKEKFGSFIVKNSDMPKLQKGINVKATTSSGEDATIKRIGDL